MEVQTFSSVVLRRPEVLDDVESGGGDDDIEFVEAAVCRLDTTVEETNDVISDELDVVSGQGSVPAVSTIGRRTMGA